MYFWKTEKDEWKWFVNRIMQYFLEKNWAEEDRLIRERLEAALEKKRSTAREVYRKDNAHIIMLEQLTENAGREAALRFLDIYIRKETAIKKAQERAYEEKKKLFGNFKDFECRSDNIFRTRCLYLAEKAHKGSLRELVRFYLNKTGKHSTEDKEIMADLVLDFDKIAVLDNRSMQRLLREINNSVLSRALIRAEKKTCEKVLWNLSRKDAATIRENMDFVMPRKESDISASQDSIIETLLRLVNDGDIVIPSWKDVLVYE
jgi:hypothetical protein